MEVLFLAILSFVILIPLVLGIILPICKNHDEATNNIINYDFAMRKFVYKVNLSRETIISSLKVTNASDNLSCTFDLERSVIKFSEYGSNREYFFQIEEYDGFSILRLEQVALIGMQGHIPYKLNPFIVRKLEAEIIPFS